MSFLIPSMGRAELVRWMKLPDLPDREGFAGSYAGVHNGALIVAGGANFPGKRPWEGGAKVWYDSIFVLEHAEGQWKSGFKLPHALGYGVSLSHSNGLICIGGSEACGHRAEVFQLSWRDGKIQISNLAKLPKPCANMCGALIGNVIYVAGGTERPDATNALRTFWALDLSKPQASWQELEPWPGPGRMLAIAGSQAGSFYLFGGAGLSAGADQKTVREWLCDAYVYVPGKGWKALASMPRPAVAAPTPAPVMGSSSLLLLGGDDGAQVSTPPTEHTGFPKDVLVYHIGSNCWTKGGTLPFSLVTTPLVEWNGRMVVPGGEKRPGVRSTEVWAGTPLSRPELR